MASVIRIVVFNADETFGPALRTTLLKFEGVKIAAEVDEPVLVPQAVSQFPCDILVAHLDPAPEAILPLLSQVAVSRPEMAIFAVSGSSDGQLILAAFRSGAREFLTKPIDPAVLEEALGKVSERSTSHGKQGSLITVIGGAGGVGATTLAVNLAVELHDATRGSVIVADLDHRFGQVATLLDVEPTYTIADLCATPEQLEPQMLERALVAHASGIRVLGRPHNFAQADNITAAHCVGVLSALTAISDFVVVDGPTRFDFGTKAVLDIADFNLMVVQLLVPTVRSVHRMLEGMMEIGFNLERMKLVCNRVGCEGSGISPQDVQVTLNREIFGIIPDDWTAVAGSINEGRPLKDYAERSKARAAIQALARRLANNGVEEDSGENKKKGFFGIFGSSK